MSVKRSQWRDVFLSRDLLLFNVPEKNRAYNQYRGYLSRASHTTEVASVFELKALLYVTQR